MANFHRKEKKSYIMTDQMTAPLKRLSHTHDTTHDTIYNGKYISKYIVYK